MPNYFLQTIEHLRHYEEVLLFDNLLTVSEAHEEEATGYLAREYMQEQLHYPFTAPAFELQPALWAAKSVYIATQLLLYREHKDADLEVLLPSYKDIITPGAILSADLLLRFLPDVINQLKVIDPSDRLIAVLEAHLQTWHYSGVGYLLPTAVLDFDAIVINPCVHQLYTDRVVEKKERQLAKHPSLYKHIQASLGLHAKVYWSQLQLDIENGNH